MREEAVFAKQKKRVTEQLGSAMLAAIGLMVRQYMGAPTEENEGPDSTGAAWDESGGTIESGAVNESFDPARYRQLGGEMTAPTRRQSGDRADTQEQTESGRHEETERAAESAARRRQASEVQERAAAPRSGAWRQRELEQEPTPMRDTGSAWVAEEKELLLSARALSGEIERDARRYDSGFYLY